MVGALGMQPTGPRNGWGRVHRDRIMEALHAQLVNVGNGKAVWGKGGAGVCLVKVQQMGAM